MANGFFRIKKPNNEPVLGYLPGSPEKLEIKAKLAEMRSEELDIPALIGDREVRTGDLGECRIPHQHDHLLGKYHNAGADEIAQAIDAAMEARKKWAVMDWQDRSCNISEGRRSSGRSLPRGGKRIDNAWSVEERLPGRD